MRNHPVFATLWVVSIPVWAAFFVAGFEALVLVLLLEALVILVRGLWQ